MEPTDELKELESAAESVLFASGEPVHIDRICLALSVERPDAERVLRRLQDYYAFERRGMRLLQLEDKWQLCSSPDYADMIRKAFEIRKPAKLSQPALEALTIIAYYQPTTRAYVDKLRGVDSSYTVSLLLERGLIETCGHLQAPGRPLLYRTTEKFLRSFHISGLDELPPLNADDAPPQQLKIEDISPNLTEPPETSDGMTPEISDHAAPETSENAEIPLESVENVENVAASEAETAQIVENSEVETDTEMIEDATEIAESEALEDTDIATENGVPSRELMSADFHATLTEYPAIERSANATRKRKRVKRRRTVKRLADTFRTPRKRRGRRKRTNYRKTARPQPLKDRSPVPERSGGQGEGVCDERPAVLETGPHTKRENVPQTAPKSGVRRKLSGKIVRRCFRCLLYGCWLSWPFFSS